MVLVLILQSEWLDTPASVSKPCSRSDSFLDWDLSDVGLHVQSASIRETLGWEAPFWAEQKTNKHGWDTVWNAHEVIYKKKNSVNKFTFSQAEHQKIL